MTEPTYGGCLEHLRKEAKNLVKAVRQGDPDAVARLAAHLPHAQAETIRLTNAQHVIAREHGYASWPKMQAALRHGTLAEEIARVHQQLTADGKTHFIPLLTGETVKQAIRKGMESYAAGRPDKQLGRTYLEHVVQPCMSGIMEKDAWPGNARLDVYYTQTDEHGVQYEGIGVSLELRTPGAAFPGFSLAILDLWYGRF